jgi:hypothetical protein
MGKTCILTTIESGEELLYSILVDEQVLIKATLSGAQGDAQMANAIGKQDRLLAEG